MGRQASFVAAAVVAAAVAIAPSCTRADDPGLVALGAGAFDFLHNNEATEFRGEYRFANGLYLLKPLLGVLATTRSSVYAYGGVRIDWVIADHYVIMPNATVGYYSKGDGKDLGSPVEFKTGAEFAYRFDEGWRVGVAFDHISNAGLTKRNPGTESLLLMVSLPINGAP